MAKSRFVRISNAYINLETIAYIAFVITDTFQLASVCFVGTKGVIEWNGEDAVKLRHAIDGYMMLEESGR